VSLFSNHSSCLKREEDLQRRIRDLEQDIRDLQTTFASERDKLLDKILAMANPAAVREYRKIPLEAANMVVTAARGASEDLNRRLRSPQRINWPGYRADDRPQVIPEIDKTVPAAAAKPAFSDIKDPAAYRRAVASEKAPSMDQSSDERSHEQAI